MFKKILSIVFASSLLGVTPLMAQTAAQTLPGYLSPYAPNCPSSPGSYCFAPLGSVIPGVAGSAVSSVVLKASPGDLLGVYVTSGAIQGWLMVFNSTSAPSDGSTTAGTAANDLEECVYVPADQTIAIAFQGLPVERYSTGITAVYSSTGCSSKTASATAFIHGLAR